jgi:hypothetical protein
MVTGFRGLHYQDPSQDSTCDTNAKTCPANGAHRPPTSDVFRESYGFFVSLWFGRTATVGTRTKNVARICQPIALAMKHHGAHRHGNGTRYRDPNTCAQEPGPNRAR